MRTNFQLVTNNNERKQSQLAHQEKTILNYSLKTTIDQETFRQFIAYNGCCLEVAWSIVGNKLPESFLVYGGL